MSAWKFDPEKLEAMRMAIPKLSRGKLGKAIGASGQHIKNVEDGDHVPSGKSIERLCNYFGVSPNAMFSEQIGQNKNNR